MLRILTPPLPIANIDDWPRRWCCHDVIHSIPYYWLHRHRPLCNFVLVLAHYVAGLWRHRCITWPWGGKDATQVDIIQTIARPSIVRLYIFVHHNLRPEATLYRLFVFNQKIIRQTMSDFKQSFIAFSETSSIYLKERNIVFEAICLDNMLSSW